MGLIDFVKSAGEKLFGRGKTQTAMAEMQAAPADPAKVAAANAAVIALARAAAMDLARCGIGVKVMSPRLVRTPVSAANQNA